MKNLILTLLILFIATTSWAGATKNYGSSTDTIPVKIKEPTSFKVNLLFHSHGNDITLASNTAIGDTVVSLDPGHGAVIGNYVGFKHGVRFYDGEIVGVNVNDITLDSPLDYAFTTDTELSHIHKPDMNVDGSSVTQVYHLTPPLNSEWDITRIICIIEDNAAMDSTKFGGASALTNGILFRVVNGTYQNIWNVKSNGDFGLASYDLTYDDRASPTLYGLRTRSTFGGIDKRGAIFHLKGGEDLQLLIQDDVTGVSKFRCMGQGRVTPL